jgi:hypothetical protein
MAYAIPDGNNLAPAVKAAVAKRSRRLTSLICQLCTGHCFNANYSDMLSKNFTDEQPLYNGFFMKDEFIGGNVSLHAIYRFILQAHLVLQPQFFVSFNSTEQLYNVLITWDIGLAILMSHR